MDLVTLQIWGAFAFVMLFVLALAYYVVREDKKAQLDQESRIPTRTIEMPVKLVMNFYD